MKARLLLLFILLNGVCHLQAQTTTIVDPNFEQALISLGMDSDFTVNGSVATSDIAGVTTLPIISRNIINLTGIEDFASLTTLLCSGNYLIALDLSNNANLEVLHCDNNNLTDLNVTGNSALKMLICSDNQLTNFNLGNNTSLLQLICSNNQLEGLKLDQNITLTTVLCDFNKLEGIDINNGNNSIINTFSCSNNPLLTCIKVGNEGVAKAGLPPYDTWVKDPWTSYSDDCNFTYIPDDNFEQALIDMGYDYFLDDYVVTSNIELIKSLNVSNSGIADLKGIKDFLILRNLDCSGNNITALDVSSNSLLNTLTCDNNQLIELDLSLNTNLTSLSCTNNQLEKINVRNGYNSLISDFDASNNPEFACILVDNKHDAIAGAFPYTDWLKDDMARYAEDSLYTYVPDDRFEQYLIDNWHDDVLDNYVLTENIVRLEYIFIGSESPSIPYANNLTGVEDFLSLRILDCSFNTIDSLDLSQNAQLQELDGERAGLKHLVIKNNSALTTVNCNNNSLEELITGNALVDLNCISAGITNLDLHQSQNLQTLKCYRNPTKILDLSQNTALTDLEFGNVQLESVNLSQCTALERLYIEALNYTSETYVNLDLSQNTALIYLECIECYYLDLDLSQNTALRYLKIYGSKLKSLDLSLNTALRDVEITQNAYQRIEFGYSTELHTLHCEDNQLTHLDVSQLIYLNELSCGGNPLITLNIQTGYNPLLNHFFAVNTPYLRCIQVDDPDLANSNDTPYDSWIIDETASYSLGCEPDSIYIPDMFFELALIDLGIDSDGTVNKLVAVNDAEGITALNVDQWDITDLAGIEGFTNLTNLSCQDNNLVYLNLELNTALTVLNCSRNEIFNLDIRQNTALLELYCNLNVFESLNVSNNTALTVLECRNNYLPSLELELNTALNRLDCSSNQITSLDLSSNTSLTDLYCRDNPITSLDLSHNTDLRNLNCSHNELTSLDLSQNSALTDLSCIYNHLTDLDLSQNTALTDLNCSFNELSSLDVSSNVSLTNLYCDNNHLTSLILGNNNALTSLYCHYNLLENLLLDQNPGLGVLICSNNSLTSLDLSLNSSLGYLSCQNNYLTSLNVRNGNNSNFLDFNASNNFVLECIQVDNETDAKAGVYPYDLWQKDEIAKYSEDCEGLAILNTISGTISIDEPEFDPNNFGVAIYDAGIPFEMGSSLQYGVINTDGTYTIDLMQVDENISDFIILFLAGHHMDEFYVHVPVDQPQNATWVQRGATGIDAHLSSNSISGTISVSGEFELNNFGVSVYNANEPFGVGSPLADASGNINEDGTYTVYLNSVPSDINEFIVLFMSGTEQWEFYDNIPYDHPENATTVNRGATNINAFLGTNSISGTITVDDEFNALEYGVGVYQAGAPFEPGASLAWGAVNEDGSYTVDLSMVDNAITDFIVLFMAANQIWEFYDDIPLDQPENAVLVQAGATGVDAHLASNSIRGTIRAEEGFDEAIFGVSVYEYGAAADPRSTTELASGVVNPDGTYSVDLSEVDNSIKEFVVLFLASHHIWEYYEDVYIWEDANSALPVVRGATGVDAYMNTNTIKGTISLDEGEIVPEELHVGVVENGTEYPLQSMSLPYTTQVNPDGTYVIDLSQVENHINEFNVVFIGYKYISELYNDVAWQTPELSELVIRGGTNIDAQLIYDKVAPVLTVQDISRNNDWNEAGAEVQLLASASDNSGLHPYITYVPESRSFFPLGETTVLATATDGAGNQDTRSFTVTVLDVQPPELSVSDIVVENDPGQAGASVELNATATDNSGEVPVIAYSQASGSFFPIGISEVTCTATDGSGNVTIETFTVEVLDVEAPVISAPDLSVNNDPGEVGALIIFTASATDNSGESPVTSFSHESGSFFPIGSTEVSCTATDAAGNTSSETFVVTVIDNEPPVLTVEDVTVNNDPGLAGAYVTLLAVSSDNSGIEPSFEFTPASGSFFGIGETVVSCTSTDPYGNATSESFTLTVIDNEPPVLTVENITVDADPGVSGAFVSYWANTYDNSGLEPAVEFIPASGSFFSTGVTMVECISTDPAGNSTSATFTVTVNEVVPENEIPVIISLTAPIDPLAVEMSVPVSAVFEDDNLTDAVFDWGDGTSSSGIIGGNTISGEHQYMVPGVYTLSLTILDEFGESDTEIYQYIVIYDPEGGFVTGGGWILSPAGAYIPDPALEGKANFGFVAKYKKGATVPDGNTEFQFKAGDLNFKSSSYYWLVVAGEKAKFKGEGTINKTGVYGFMISAIDGDEKGKPDMFRIKIWELGTESLVYDNQFGEADDADATCVLGGGSITVHDSKLKSASLTLDNMEKQGLPGIKVYPNPVSGNLKIELPSYFVEEDNISNIHLINALGSVIKTENIANINSTLMEIDMSGMRPGYYTLIILTRDFTYQFPIIKD